MINMHCKKVLLLLSMRYCVVHGALLHPDPEVVLGRGYAIPPFIQRMGSPSPAIQDIHMPRKVRVINSISQFDEPGGWKPVKEKYDEKDFEDGFKEDDKPVTGPPYGKHFHISHHLMQIFRGN